MTKTANKEIQRTYRHTRIRKKISGSSERPRLCVHRSLNNFYAQIVDDSQRKVLFGMSTLNKAMKDKLKAGGNIGAATQLGEAFAAEAKKKGVSKVSFDRGGYPYHGRIKAFAEAAREGGLEF